MNNKKKKKKVHLNIHVLMPTLAHLWIVFVEAFMSFQHF